MPLTQDSPPPKAGQVASTPGGAGTSDAGDDRIVVVIPIKNKRAYVERCLDSIIAAADPQVEIIVVDNGSTDGSLELVERYRPAVRVLQAAGTISAIRNLGASASTAGTICFLDSDVVVPADYFQHVRAVLSDPGVWATGYPVGLPSDARWLEREWHRLHEMRPGTRVRYINSGNFVVRRSAFEAVGGFDETLRTGEDTDVCRRLEAAGFPLAPSRALEVAHLDNPKSAGAFFRKQVWHGQGMAQGNPWRTPCRVTVATAGYMGCQVAALGTATLGLSVAAKITIAALLHVAIPAVTVAARMRRRGKLLNPFYSLLLYDLYFAARSVALVQLAARTAPLRRSGERVKDRVIAQRP